MRKILIAIFVVSSLISCSKQEASKDSSAVISEINEVSSLPADVTSLAQDVTLSSDATELSQDVTLSTDVSASK